MSEAVLGNGVLDDAALDRIFRSARTLWTWPAGTTITEADLREIYELMKWGPTSANSSPARFVCVTSEAGHERLKPSLSAGNLDKTMQAPATVIVAYDPRFYDQLPTLFPHADARSWFAGSAVLAEETAMRNSSLQGAYFIVAARALGYDCGPMSGFDRGKVDEAFFAESGWKSNFLINIGRGADPASAQPRLPRLTFEQACSMA